jgi:hypothetical protein
MSKIEARLKELGYVTPPPMQPPAGMTFPFSWVRLAGDRAYVSGHNPMEADGTPVRAGKVGAEVSVEEGYRAARLVALAHLGSLRAVLGDLDRIRGFLRVFAMVNVAPGFYDTPKVTNGYSDFILSVFGPSIGDHARASIGMVLPLNAPVNCEAEVWIDA